MQEIKGHSQIKLTDGKGLFYLCTKHGTKQLISVDSQHSDDYDHVPPQNKFILRTTRQFNKDHAMPTLRLDLSRMEASSSPQAQQHNHHVAEIVSSSTKAFPSDEAKPLALPVTPCTIASHQDGGASVSQCRSPDSTTVPPASAAAEVDHPGQRRNATSRSNSIDATTERAIADNVAFLRKIRTKIAGDQAFRQRLRTAIALHENRPRQDVLLAALSASRKVPPPPLTGPAATIIPERSQGLLGLLRRGRSQNRHHEMLCLPSSNLEAELAELRQIRWHLEQRIGLSTLIEQEMGELQAERLDLAIQAAKLQAQAASLRWATKEAELLASETRTAKRDTHRDRQREDLAASASSSSSAQQYMRRDDDTVSTEVWNAHLQSLIQSMLASEASFVELQFLYGAHGSLPSSYRAVINQSQASRQDILVLLGEKRKRDNCIVGLYNRNRPTKRRKKQNGQDATSTSSSQEKDQSSTCKSTSPSSPSINSSVIPSKRSTGRKSKKAKRWTWKKRPGAPSRPLSAYNIFFSEERRRIIDEMERKKSCEIDSTAGQDDGDDNIESPDQVSTKPTCTTTAGTTDNNTDDTSTSITSSSASQHPGEVAFDMLMERRINPTTNYKQRNAMKVTKQSVVAYKDLTKIIAGRWKCLPPNELAEYKRLADLDKKRYKEDLEKFNNRQEEVSAAETLKDLIRGSVVDA